MKTLDLVIVHLVLSLVVVSCQDNNKEISPPVESVSISPDALFEPVSTEHSGVLFTNTITETPELNYFTFQYIYNGGGVATGDINNDGLVDIYLTGNMVSDKLYLNRGDMTFEDITDKALPGLPNTWHQGVAMADVNEDGFLDIYICRAGYYTDPNKLYNLFYENNGDGTFTERSSEYGLADTTRSTQAAFFDMDNDGDLDLYVMNTPLHSKGIANVDRIRLTQQGLAPSDNLYRNDNGRFTKVSMEYGVQNFSYGLGLSISDLNQDNRPDIYVSHDYDLPDMMYINRGETFQDELQGRTRHISNFGMGSDIADYNNDGLPDIMVLDMVSEDHVRSKMNMGGMSTERFWKMVRIGYHHQYMINTLQLNNGNGTFSEIGQLAGVGRTDWSWSALFADLDNDGWKDLVITNGYKRDMRNNDFVGKFEGYLEETDQAEFEGILDLIPATRIHNYAFRNNGDLTFDNVSEDWGFNTPVNSNGMAYADLDNDGDLDLVINNIDEPASIMRNRSVQNGSHWIRFELKTNGRDAIGSKVTLWAGDNMQFQELFPTRGYQSSTEPVLHFGAGDAEVVDSIRVIWPSGLTQKYENLPVDTLIVLQEGGTPLKPEVPIATPFQMVEVKGLTFVHAEDPYNDFEREVLLPHKYSGLGPGICSGDANGDGLDDLFITGAHSQSSELYLQKDDGSFQRTFRQPWESHALQEQVSARFFDADNDNDQDLIVLAGGNQYDVRSDMYRHRFYRNSGKGKFEYEEFALPPMETSAGTIAVGDINGDGMADLFIGGRVTPGLYPFAPRSYLLANDGNGKFVDVTDSRAPDLKGPGMVTDAAFADINDDGLNDLVVCGEWMDISIFLNTGQGLENMTTSFGLKGTSGWWKSLCVLDIDNDGDLDIVGGNLGMNHKYHCDADHPLHVYWGDFDDSGRSDIVLAKEKGEKQLPVRGRECSSQQCPMILDKFPTYEEFAHASLGQIYSEERLSDALHLTATHMESTVFMNEGGSFVAHVLPNEAQFAPLNRIIPMDLNNDGYTDLVAAGNDWDAEVETVRYDAGTGVILINRSGSGEFDVIPSRRSGFMAWNHVKDMTTIERNGQRSIVVANNNAPLEVFDRVRPIKEDQLGLN